MTATDLSAEVLQVLRSLKGERHIHVSSRRLTVVRTRLGRRRWPIAMSALSLVTGMAFAFVWGPLALHRPYWITPFDLWGTYRSAHYIGWGYLGGIYSAGTQLVTFPGILLLLAPVAMLTGSLGLTESFPRVVPHPTAWLLLGPADILISCVALFATDALAERLGIANRSRALLCVAEGAVLWNVSVLWGHPEDALAVGLAVYALLLAIDGRWSGTGWLFGAAIATQPLVVLMLPVLLAMAGRQRAVALTIRSFAPAVLLMATPLIAEFHPTFHAIVDEPNFPNVDHVTPWTALAPVLGGKGENLAVAAGPGRIIALVLACGLGIRARKWRGHPELLVWAAASAMALRCFTESVMVPYYIWPVLAIGLVAAGKAPKRRLVAAGTLGVLVTVLSDYHVEWFWWWSLVSGGLVLFLVLGLRLSSTRPSRTGAHMPIVDNDAMSVLKAESRSPQLLRATR